MSTPTMWDLVTDPEARAAREALRNMTPEEAAAYAQAQRSGQIGQTLADLFKESPIDPRTLPKQRVGESKMELEDPRKVAFENYNADMLRKAPSIEEASKAAGRARLGLGRMPAGAAAPPKTLAPDAPEGGAEKPAPKEEPKTSLLRPPVNPLGDVIVSRGGAFGNVDPEGGAVDTKADTDLRASGRAAMKKWNAKALAEQTLNDAKPKTYSGVAPVEPGLGTSGDFRVRKFGQGAFTPSWTVDTAKVTTGMGPDGKPIEEALDPTRAADDPKFMDIAASQLSPLQKELFDKRVAEYRANQSAVREKKLQDLAVQATEEKIREETDPAYAYQKNTAHTRYLREEGLRVLADPKHPLRKTFEALLKQQELVYKKQGLKGKELADAMEQARVLVQEGLLNQWMSQNRSTNVLDPQTLRQIEIRKAGSGFGDFMAPPVVAAPPK